MLRSILVDGSWLLPRAIHGLSWYIILENKTLESI